jgi:hypothetical protein
MAIFNPADIDFNGEEIKSISEAYFESLFMKPEVGQFHEVVTGIVAKKQIAIMGRITDLVGVQDGGCDPATTALTISNSQKFWDPVIISDRFGFCWTELKEIFFVWGLKKGIEKPDLTGTDFALFIEERLIDAIWECIYRVVWFNDKTAAVTPTGVLTAGTTLAYFNRIEGFFKQLFTIVAADADRLTLGFDAKNQAATYALQKFLPADTVAQVAINTLENMEYGADLRLRDDPGRVYIVTQSIGDQLKRELKSITTQYEIDKVVNGIEVIKFDGKTVYIFSFWDRIIKTWMDDGTTTFLPHRALLVNPIDLQMGTEGEKALDELDIFYDKKDKKTYIDFAFSIDAVFIRNEMVQTAW